MHRFLFLILCSVCSHATYAGCALDRQTLGARYTVVFTDAKGVSQESEVTIWRMKSRVLWEYPLSGIAESWHRNVREQLQLVRYFDQYDRGIEYYPADMPAYDPQSWERLWQLVPAAELESLEAGATHGDKCQLERGYSGTGHGLEVSGAWLGAAGLPSRWKTRATGASSSWQLKELVTDAKAVAQAFDSREHYQLIDYADIGDNESDPLLLKMASLGVVEHKVQAPRVAHGGHNH